MSKFTVLGGTGYIGSRLVAYLQAQGHEVWAPRRGDPDVFLQPLGNVVYCIGLTADFRSRPFDTVQAHVGLLSEVLQYSRFETLLYLSSTRVYCGAQSTHEEAPLTVLPHDPSYLYNLSKLTGESLCAACGRDGVRVARLSNVVGPGMDWRSGNLVADLIHQARQGRVALRSDPCSSKDYVHVNDVAEWLACIALQGRSRIYNVASGVQTSHGQWLSWLERHTGCVSHVLPNAPLQTFPSIAVERLQQEWGHALPRSIWDMALLDSVEKMD